MNTYREFMNKLRSLSSSELKMARKAILSIEAKKDFNTKVTTEDKNVLILNEIINRMELKRQNKIKGNINENY